MRFTSLRTFNFRNLKNAKTAVDAKDVFLVGENGQGKSNFLEAIYFCSYASSFRVVTDREFVCTGEKDCSVEARIDSPIDDSIQVSIISEKKNVCINGKSTKDRKALLSIAPAIVFCYEDMQFINGTPEQRRWFFDQNLCLYDISYVDDLRKYKKILKTRNTIMKELKDRVHNNYELLDVIDPQFVECGFYLTCKRKAEAAAFSEILTPLFKTVSGIEDVGVEYHPSWKNHEGLLQKLAEKREREIALGVSLSGPHRDNYIFVKQGTDFSRKASTGQRRLLALLMRVAQAQRYHIMQNKKPILLFDDVLLELDGEKRIKFFSVMPEYEQAFFTFLPEEPYGQYRKDDTIIYSVREGGLIGSVQTG